MATNFTSTPFHISILTLINKKLPMNLNFIINQFEL
nr:MAG TPA: hypothetical protein [Caudoviricetes sp.]